MGSVNRFFYSLTHLKRYREVYDKDFKSLYEKIAKEVIVSSDEKKWITINTPVSIQCMTTEPKKMLVKDIDFKKNMINCSTNGMDQLFIFPDNHLLTSHLVMYCHKLEKDGIIAWCGYCGNRLNMTERRNGLLNRCLGEKGYNIDSVSKVIKKDMESKHGKAQRDIRMSADKLSHISSDINLISIIKCSPVFPRCALYYSFELTAVNVWFLASVSDLVIQRIGMDKIFDYDTNALRFMRRIKQIQKEMQDKSWIIGKYISKILCARIDFIWNYNGIENEEIEGHNDSDSSSDEEEVTENNKKRNRGLLDSDYIPEEAESARPKRRIIPPSKILKLGNHED